MSISIRPLLNTDLETAQAILNLAFQSSDNRLHELRLYRQMQPDGWFAATRGEQLIGMVGAVNYGAFAHVGLMAVHPEAQRQGVGLALMQFLLAELEKQHIPLITLDASEAGRPLYDKLGFVAYDKAISMNVPSVNREAIELARSHGFELVRANLHMGRGAGGVPGQRQKIYSQTSLAVG